VGLLGGGLRGQCKDTDQATTALLMDLKRRGLLEDTLVIWGGEFGRTIYSQGGLTETNYGRDHHPRCFSMFLAGAGVKKGLTFGETDDYCYNTVRNPVHVNQLNATILHLLGINHERLTFTHQGLEARLTGVEPAPVVREILA
jgi:arylsulfatase A-like enzyme